MFTHLSSWLVAALFIVCCGVIGLFVFAEMGHGRMVPMVAGFVLGVVVGAGLMGFRTRLLDALFPPAVGEQEPDEE